jgi:hypothetical protein
MADEKEEFDLVTEMTDAEEKLDKLSEKLDKIKGAMKKDESECNAISTVIMIFQAISWFTLCYDVYNRTWEHMLTDCLRIGFFTLFLLFQDRIRNLEKRVSDRFLKATEDLTNITLKDKRKPR